MNQLYVGLGQQIELPRGGFLFVDDELPEIPRARIFDPKCLVNFNPLKDINDIKARRLAQILYTIYPEGESTLTVRNGKRSMVPALMEAKSLDTVRGDDEIMGTLNDVLVSPTLRRIFCGKGHTFSFNPRSVILARINREELGEFDALVLGLFLMEQYPGQLVVPDFGFYGRDVHSGLLRSNRLIVGVRFLSELPPKLRRNAMLIEEKVAMGAIYEDAVELGRYDCRFPPNTEGYDAFIKAAMA